MAFPKKLIDLIGITLTLMVLTLPSIVANIDCNGKPFHCLNSTHFMICVDLGSGVSSTIDDFVIECPPPTVCQRTNKFECDFPVETSITVAPIEAPIVTSVSEILETVTTPYELTTSVPIEQYFDTSTTTTLSEDVLITHQTIAIVTESTTQLVTDVTQNNEVIIPLNETIPSVNVQNDLITTTSLPNNIRIDATETISDAFAKVNVTVPEIELNSTVTENILGADVVHTNLTTASTLPNNINASALYVFQEETEKVNITHESITNSTLNETIQSATELARNEQSLYTTSSIGMLSETTTETIPSLVDIQNNVTKPIPMYISASNITGLINDTAENIGAIISVSKINSTVPTTDPSEILDIVTTVLYNYKKNKTDLIKDPVENNTLSKIGVKSQLNLSDIVESTTESILYNVTESIPSTQNDLTKFTPNNSSANAIDIFLEPTEKVSVVLSTSEINSTLTVKTTPNVDVVQHESTTLNNNKSDYVTDLIPNTTETIDIIISDVTVQSVIDIAQNEPTLLSTSNSTIITTTSTYMVTESILTEVTKLTSNETYLSSDALPIVINDTTTETTLNNVSETILNIEAQKDLLLDHSSFNIIDDTIMNTVLHETTSNIESNTAQNELSYISTSSTLIPSPITKTISEVLHKVPEITTNAPVSKISLSLDEEQNFNKTPTLLSNKFPTKATYSMLDATDTTVLLPESVIDYSLNATITSVDVGKNDSTTPLPSINDYTTVLILNNTENSNVTDSKHYSTSKETIQNKTHTVEIEHTLLVNVSSSTALPDIDTESIWEKPMQNVGETTPSTYFEQNNFTKNLHENNTLSAADLILDVKENVLVPGSKSKSNETRSVNFVQNETISITLPVTNLITEATKSVNMNMLEPERNPTLNATVPRVDDTVHNYSDTLNSITLPNNNAHLATESILGEVTSIPHLSVDTVQIVGETTPSTYFEQNNFTKTLYENNTLSAADLILNVKENVLVPGSKTKLSETRSENFVQNETISITLPVTNLTAAEATKSVNKNMLEPERNPTSNVTVPRVDDAVQNYSNTLNSITLLNNNADLATESILGEVTSVLHLSVDTVHTSYTSNTTLPDKLVNIVTEFQNVIIAETNLTLSDSSLVNPEEVTKSNERKIENETIVSNNSQPQPYAQNITASNTINIEPIYTNNEINLSVNKINQVNSTVKVSVTSSLNLKTTLVNDKNKTVVDATTVFPEDLNAVTFSNINIDSQTSSVKNKNNQGYKNENNTINKENFLTGSIATGEVDPNYLANATSEQNIESSTQHTDSKNDSHVELDFSESVKGRPVNIPNTVQITLNSIIVENDNFEIVSDSSTNLDTTTSTSELVNQGLDFEKTKTYTIHKETTEITASEYGMRTFQTEFPTIRATVVADTLAPTTESLGKAYITDSATVNSIAGVTELYSKRNVLADANSDTNTLMKSSVGAVNIGVETTKEIKPILQFNSLTEPISYGGQITTDTSIISKSSPAQDTVNPTTTYILFASRVPSLLTQENMAASIHHEVYTESTVNIDLNLQKSISNEIVSNKIAHTIQNSDSLTDTLNTSAAHKDFTQETKNLESHTSARQVLGNSSENKQEPILEKSNLPKMEQNQGIKANNQTNTHLDILLKTPIHLMMSSQPTVPQTKYAADYTPINTLSIVNLTHLTDDYANKKVPIEVDTETKLGIELNQKSIKNEGTKTKETVDIKHGKGNETVFMLTMNVGTPSQPKEESRQISNSSQTSTRAFPADPDHVTLELDSPDVLTIRSTTEPWRATVVTKPYINQDYATRKQHFAIYTSGFKSSTVPWRPTVVTAPQIDQETVTLKQYSTDSPILKPLTKAWRTPVVTKPDIDVAITSSPLIKIEQKEARDKLPVIKDTNQSVNKQTEGISVIQRRVTNTNANEKHLIDVKSTTEPYKESWNKVSQNGDGILDNSQSKQHLPAPTMELINIYPVTQKTEPVVTKTLASNMDIDIVTIDVVKTNVPLSIQSDSSTSTYSDLSVKLPRTEKGYKSEPEEFESVEQPERNEEQEISEYEESQRENMEEKLEASEDQKSELIKAGVVSTQNNVRFESTVKMTTPNVEDKSYRHYTSITNIEVQPTIVKSTVNLEETKIDTRTQIGRNVKNSTVGYSLSKSFVNTHNVTAPVFEPAKSSFVCKLNSRGKFPDNNDCRKFYICIGKHEPIEGLCPINTVFSELRKQCTKNFSHCVRNNQFQCVLEGRFSDYLNDNIYYICVKNNVGTFTRFKLQCQSGYRLNKTSVRCALNTESSRPTSQQSISDISKNSEQSVSSARSEKLVVESSNKFECESEGKFPDPYNCRKYYVCSKKNGKSRYRQKRKKCDSDEIFHKDKKKCVDAESYDCS